MHTGTRCQKVSFELLNSIYFISKLIIAKSYQTTSKRFRMFSLINLIANDLHVHCFLYIRKTTPWLKFSTTYHTAGVEIGQTAKLTSWKNKTEEAQ